MKKRWRVGFVLDLDDAWLGGLNYYRNLVTAIYDDPVRTFDVVLFVGRNVDAARLVGFPEVEIVRTAALDRDGLVRRIRGRILRQFGRDLVLSWVLNRHGIDVLSHYGEILGRNKRTLVIAWIPDFQHLHLAEHFTEHEREDRNARFADLCKHSDLVILSSESARSDLLGLYPAMAQRSAVLPFVPHVEADRALPTRTELESRYGFSGPFIHLPNQYWAHKNHRVVIDALGVLAKQGRRVTVISTGSPSDYRNPDHYAGLEKRIAELDVGASYVRLGVVPYADLLVLMMASVCLINPSLFEGWSTTVEEARALDKFILLSDIPVHREQSPPRCAFFKPDDAATLADLMWAQWQRAAEEPASTGLSAGHGERRAAFARRYRNIVAQALASPRSG